MSTEDTSAVVAPDELGNRPAMRRVGPSAIEGFEQLTLQQIFDMSLNHLRTTRVKSVAPLTSSCLYGGTGCAAAPFLKPEKRKELDDTGSWSWISLVEEGIVPGHMRGQIRSIQAIHDNCSDFRSGNFMEQIERGFMEFAGNNHLVYTPEPTP